MRPGTRVEVRSRFEERWTRGFEIAAYDESVDPPVYLVRRRSDGSVLPVGFAPETVREERRRSMWWI